MTAHTFHTLVATGLLGLIVAGFAALVAAVLHTEPGGLARYARRWRYEGRHVLAPADPGATAPMSVLETVPDVSPFAARTAA